MFNKGTNSTNMGGNHLPQNGDVIALSHANGGYVGGYRNHNDKLVVVGKRQEWELFTFEAVDNKFALKQKVSGHYVGGVGGNGEQVYLANHRQNCELYKYNLLPNGMVTITNCNGNNLSRNGQKLELRNQTTINESWRFELVEKGNPTSSTALHMVNSTKPVSQGNFGNVVPPNGSIVAL
jgi:hypothetical protein